MTDASARFEIEHRPLAVVRDFDGFRLAFRARSEELNVSRATIDRVGGMADGQVSKLLSPVRDQEMGPITFAAMLGALGLACVVVEDADAIARIRHRLTARSKKHAHMQTDEMLTKRRASMAAKKRSAVRRGDSAWGLVMAARRVLKVPAHKRKAIAAAAARARWSKRRGKAKVSP